MLTTVQDTHGYFLVKCLFRADHLLTSTDQRNIVCVFTLSQSFPMASSSSSSLTTLARMNLDFPKIVEMGERNKEKVKGKRIVERDKDVKQKAKT